MRRHAAAGAASGRRRTDTAWPAWLWLLAGILAMLAVAPAWSQPASIPELRQRVTDTTGTLDAPTQERLTQALAGLEQRKGAQIAILMIPTTGQEGIEQYAVRAFEQWRLGREAVDDGILFLIAKDDRRLRIEVGYGLEGAVPDLLAGRIIREQVAPRFQQGDFAGGVEAGVDSLVSLVDGEALPPPEHMAEESSGAGDTFGIIAMLAIMATVLPPVIAVAGAALLTYLIFGSLVFAVLAGMAAFLLSLTGRALKTGGGGARASRRGGVIGGLGGMAGGGGFGRGGFGGGGFGGGGFGGGGFGGGGGSSGGGGASGSW